MQKGSYATNKEAFDHIYYLTRKRNRPDLRYLLDKRKRSATNKEGRVEMNRNKFLKNPYIYGDAEKTANLLKNALRRIRRTLRLNPERSAIDAPLKFKTGAITV